MKKFASVQVPALAVAPNRYVASRHVAWRGGTASVCTVNVILAVMLSLFSLPLFGETPAQQSFEGMADETLSYTANPSPDIKVEKTLIRNTAPVVSNVCASQRTDGSKIVDIWYDLYDANDELCDITLKLSANGGASYDIIPSPANLSGDFGDDQPSGTSKHIVWNAGAEGYSLDASYLYRVYADDGFSPPMPQNFVFVAGGTFNNGTSNVSVSSFYIDKYELTQAGYQAVMGSNPASYYGVGPNYPVYFVSWFKAIEYCNRRSMQEGLPPCYSYGSYGTNPDDWPAGWNTSSTNHTNVSCSWAVNGYRLPTEAEWQFAARGGTQSHNYLYSGGNELWGVGWFESNSNGTSHYVGMKAANELGIFDMSGNIWEWNWDIFGGYPTGAQTDPHGPISGSDRVVRGGCFNSVSYNCSVSYRYIYYTANFSYYTIGFRCVRISP